MECQHDELEFTAQFMEADLALFRYALIYVRCTSCQQQFHWRGLESGRPNPDVPVTSADGFELRAPLVAGPGATVGLLQSVGLVDKLVNPENGAQADA